MCGIVGYIGPRQAAGLLLEGLRRLEYRGYDSAGIAIVNGDGLEIMKAAGKLCVLEQELERRHARRAPSASGTPAGPRTARRPATRIPHRPAGRIAVVHNGIIENSDAIRKALEQRGHRFKSETDTEVLAHLVGEFYQGNLEEAVAAALRDVDGRLRARVHLGGRARRARRRAQGLARCWWAWARTSTSSPRTRRRCCSTPARWSTSTTARWSVLTRDGYRVRNLETHRDQQAGQPDRLGPRR